MAGLAVAMVLTPDAFLNPHQNYTDNGRYNILSEEASYISETLASAGRGTKASIITAKKKGLAVISEKLSIAGKTYRTVEHVQ